MESKPAATNSKASATKSNRTFFRGFSFFSGLRRPLAAKSSLSRLRTLAAPLADGSRFSGAPTLAEILIFWKKMLAKLTSGPGSRFGARSREIEIGAKSARFSGLMTHA
jgi:hypothetical protein